MAFRKLPGGQTLSENPGDSAQGYLEKKEESFPLAK